MSKESRRHKASLKKFGVSSYTDAEIIPRTLDPNKYSWKQNHRPCRGTGILGEEVNKHIIFLCSCVKEKGKQNEIGPTTKGETGE